MLFQVVPKNMLWTVPGDNTLFAPYDIAGGEYDFNYAGLKSVRHMPDTLIASAGVRAAPRCVHLPATLVAFTGIFELPQSVHLTLLAALCPPASAISHPTLELPPATMVLVIAAWVMATQWLCPSVKRAIDFRPTLCIE